MAKAEQWRPIPGFGGWYELSRHGEIRSWYTTRQTAAGKAPDPAAVYELEQEDT